MSDEPSDIERKRAERERSISTDEPVFQFAPYTFNPTGVGLIEGDLPVCVVLDPGSLTGVVMTREDAVRLAHELLGTAISKPDEETDPG